MKPKVKFLTVVWGEAYIRRFCALSLPSFVSPGNLPALARDTSLEVVIMTRRNDRKRFEGRRVFERLKAICDVRFVDIDDLITTAVYGVTLTLAYARPIIACGEEMLDTHFVFMNADFVIADGSLRALAKHIHDGRAIVLGPSYRAIADEVEPVLERMIDRETGILEVAPRKMVELSLPFPHRTTTAKLFNQDVFCSTHPNQLFWRVDEHTLLGRYFLVFMLCLKPERVMSAVNCYCDYSFIPELCPSGDEIAMADSDDFFMLELQGRAQETFMLRPGQMTEKAIAASLQEWSTAAHRRAADFDIVFHSRDIPPGIVQVKAVAQRTIDGIRSRLGRPKSHVNHRYWVLGVEAWKRYRKGLGRSQAVPELAPYSLGLVPRLLLVRHKLVRTLGKLLAIGSEMESRLNPRWAALRMFRSALGARGSIPDEHSTLVAGNVRGLRPLLPPSFDGLLISEWDLFVRHSRGDRQFARIVLHADSFQEGEFGSLMTRCLELLSPSGSIDFLIGPGESPWLFHTARALSFSLAELAGSRLRNLSVTSTGSLGTDLSSRLYSAAERAFSRARRLGVIPATAIALPISLAAKLTALVANAIGAGPRDKLARRCNGVIVRMDLF
jgi:hypothetical protein